MFNAYVAFAEHDHQNIMNFFGYSFETAGNFFDKVVKTYLGTDDEEKCKAVVEKAMVIGYTKLLRRSIKRPNEPESAVRIKRCKEMLEVLLNKVDTLVF